MSKPRPHAELIKAWADGATIERLWNDLHGIQSAWLIDNEPDWSEFEEYRIKPVPKDNVVKFFKLESHPLAGLRFSDATNMPCHPDDQIIKVTFDGETGQMIKVTNEGIYE